MRALFGLVTGRKIAWRTQRALRMRLFQPQPPLRASFHSTLHVSWRRNCPKILLSLLIHCQRVFSLCFIFQVQYMPNFLCFGSITVITIWRSSLQEGKKYLFLYHYNLVELKLMWWCISDARLCVKTRCCAYVVERWRECVGEELGLVCMQIALFSGESRRAVYEGERRGAPVCQKSRTFRSEVKLVSGILEKGIENGKSRFSWPGSIGKSRSIGLWLVALA